MKKNIFATFFSTTLLIFILSFILPFVPGFPINSINYSSILVIICIFFVLSLIEIKILFKRILPGCFVLGVLVFFICINIKSMLAGILFGIFVMIFAPVVLSILICVFSLKLFEFFQNNHKYYLLLCLTISVLMLIVAWNNVTNFIADKETDSIVRNIHEIERKCISHSAHYGVPFNMLIKTCDEDYEVVVSKKVCKILVNNKFDSAQYEDGLKRQHLDEAIVKSVSNGSKELTTKSCKKENLIMFNIIPNLDNLYIKNNYNPKKVDNVDYVNINGKIRIKEAIIKSERIREIERNIEKRRQTKNNVYESKSLKINKHKKNNFHN